MVERRTVTIWTYAVIAWAGALGLMVWPALVDRRFREPATGPWIVVITACATLAVVWTIVFVRLIWRRSDEYMREGSKFAWYWGGTLGLLASLPLYVFILSGGLHWLDPARFHLGKELAFAFRFGFGLAVAGQAAGFLIALAYWRWAKR